MNKKILYLSIFFAITGCQTNNVKETSSPKEKSFFIPFFNEVINYKSEEETNTNVINEKEYMYLIMQGQLELNKNNNLKALEYFEKSMNIRYTDISYTILDIYFKEKNYLKSMEIANKIYTSNRIVTKNKDYENLIIYLFNNENLKSIEIINKLIKNINTNENNVNNLGMQVNIYKEIADIMIFTRNELSIIKDKINKDDFTLIEFFYMYNLSNQKGEEPDEVLNYLITNKNKNNLLHNFTVFRVGYIENYHIDSYKDEVKYVIDNVDNYKFDLSILEKFYNYNLEEYEILKSKLIKKYASDYNFWIFLSILEKEDKTKSLLNSLKAYKIIKRDKVLVQNKEFLISNIINLQIENNNFNIKPFVNDYKEYSKKEMAVSFMILNMINKNKFNYNHILKYQSTIPKTDIDLLISKNYYYLEKYNEALIYINKSEEEISNNLEINLYKILILGEKNKKIGLNEAEIFYNDNKNIDSKLILLYMNYLNNIKLQESLKESDLIQLKSKEQIQIDDFKQLPLYLSAQLNYKLKKYNEAKEIFDLMIIDSNYAYLADYGRILWHLNQKEDAIKYFKQSKSILNSIYLKNIIKELKIKPEDI